VRLGLEDTTTDPSNREHLTYKSFVYPITERHPSRDEYMPVCKRLMPQPPLPTGLRYPLCRLRALPSEYHVVIPFTDYNCPQYPPRPGLSGCRRQQKRYGCGPGPAPIETELTFSRCKPRLTSNPAYRLGTQGSADEPPHSEDISDVFGVVKHLRAPLEWAVTYYFFFFKESLIVFSLWRL